VATASGGLPSVEEREGVKNRGEERKNTRLNVIAVLVAALVGAVAGLGGVLVGVNITADRDDQRSTREFLQTQRISVYGEYLAGVDEARALVEPFLPAIEADRGTSRPLAEYSAPDEEQMLAIRQSLDRVETFSGRVQILAEDELTQAAELLHQETISMVRLMQTMSDCDSDLGANPYCAMSVDDVLGGATTWSDGQDQPEWSSVHFSMYRGNYLERVVDELDIPE
jgi:hypothetical protein